MEQAVEGPSTDNLEGLRRRAKRCVCGYCGGELELREIAYSSYAIARTEVFCSQCGRMEWGVEPEVLAVAEGYLREVKFDVYKDMAPSELKNEMNRARLCEILTWGLESLGILGESGFKQKVDLDEVAVGSLATWSYESLEMANDGFSKQEGKR